MTWQYNSWHISGENMVQKDTRTPMFIAVLFTIAKTWKQPKCPSTDEWIKKMQYIITQLLKRVKQCHLPTWMDLEIS